MELQSTYASSVVLCNCTSQIRLAFSESHSSSLHTLTFACSHTVCHVNNGLLLITDRREMEGWVGLVSWSVTDSLPKSGNLSTIDRVQVREVCQPKTDILTTELHCQPLSSVQQCFDVVNSTIKLCVCSADVDERLRRRGHSLHSPQRCWCDVTLQAKNASVSTANYVYAVNIVWPIFISVSTSFSALCGQYETTSYTRPRLYIEIDPFCSFYLMWA